MREGGLVNRMKIRFEGYADYEQGIGDLIGVSGATVGAYFLSIQ